MTVEVSQDDLKTVLQDSDVQALVISKLKDLKTDGLEASAVKQIAALFTDKTSAATATDSSTDSTTDTDSDTGTGTASDDTADDSTAVEATS